MWTKPTRNQTGEALPLVGVSKEKLPAVVAARL